MLGALSGALAAMTVLPTAIPLTRRLAATEEALALRHASAAAAVASRLLEEDGALPPGTRDRLQVAHLSVIDPDGLVLHQEGADLPASIGAVVCRAPAQMLETPDGKEWATACVKSAHGRVASAWSPDFASTSDVVYLVFTLSALVGIVTAMGVLSLLSPLSRVANALDRVGAGERGVRVAQTGLAELDELVDRVNSAARAMESREDAILARIHVVQELARLVAHEVRNPLQSLELLTSLVSDEANAEERHELADSMHLEIRELNRVVDRLLRDPAAGGGLRLHRSDQSLRPIVEHIVARRSPEAMSKGTRIEIGPVAAQTAPLDAALLGRSIENLVINAMQVVPPGYGLVRITVREEPPWAAVVVEDNGPGVDPDYGERIFEPNVTTREEGTGLGLTLVKGVVEAHGGWIEYDRSPLGGARFTARIPLREAPVEQPAPEGADRR